MEEPGAAMADISILEEGGDSQDEAPPSPESIPPATSLRSHVLSRPRRQMLVIPDGHEWDGHQVVEVHHQNGFVTHCHSNRSDSQEPSSPESSDGDLSPLLPILPEIRLRSSSSPSLL